MTQLLEQYLPLLPFFLISFILALLLTPWVGKLASAIGAVDLPPALRANMDNTKFRRVHMHRPALLGGLAMMVSLLLTLLLLGELGNFRWGIILGLIIITVVGFLDDMYQLSGLQLLLGQAFAALVVILSGITVTSIQIAGIHIDFNMYSQQFQIGEFIYNFIFPADILTLLWIVGLVNVMNWVGGVDGLNGSVSSVIAIAMFLIAMKLGLVLPAIFIVTYVGSILGVLPYNYHLSKIFYGSIGDFGNGYILAVLSIITGTKLPLFLVLMGLPFFDALVVFAGRISRNPKLLSRPWKVLQISDKTHFHHRLLDVGFSHKGVMFVETGITVALCAAALYLSDFRIDFLMLVAAGAIILISIAVLSALQRKAKHKRQLAEDAASSGPKVDVKIVDKSLDEKNRYRY